MVAHDAWDIGVAGSNPVYSTLAKNSFGYIEFKSKLLWRLTLEEKFLQEEQIFQDCLKHYLSDFTLGETWKTLAMKHDFESGEAIRWWFKNQRKKRGIPSKDKTTKNISISNAMKNGPRVAICDIESLPIILAGWQLWDQNFGIEQVLQDGCMLSWAGKFLNESEMYSDILTPAEVKKRDTARITKSIWDFLSKANFVIGHNFSQYDVKYINTEFLKHGLPPLKFGIIDTLVVAKQNFRFSSNKMKYINDQLGIRNKIDNDGFLLWRMCNEGDKDSLATMLEYNIGDIGATEELFYKVRPYVRNFNVALYNEIESEQCPVCGSENLKPEGFYYTSAGKWESVRCEDCKCVSRRKKNLLSKDKKKTLLINS